MKPGPLDIEQRDKGSLREGYSRAVRRFEIASILAYVLAMGALACRFAPRLSTNPWLALIAFMLGYLAADFVSGFVHWAADTWGTPEWPLIGKALIRPFREHHVDQKEITRHDFIETNGNNCFISLFAVVGACFVGPESPTGLFTGVFVFSLCAWVLGTNQFHKWAHLDAPPPFVAWLQRINVVLPPDHHRIHHSAPFAKYYCITVGWLNEPLYRLRFFKVMERLVTALTGLLPREDDIGKRAALAIALQPQEPIDLPKLPLPDVRLPNAIEPE
jgi:ubiquitin-conjugating enzyme E2 variant